MSRLKNKPPPPDTSVRVLLLQKEEKIRKLTLVLILTVPPKPLTLAQKLQKVTALNVTSQDIGNDFMSKEISYFLFLISSFIL
jgi:hypothetical protein